MYDYYRQKQIQQARDRQRNQQILNNQVFTRSAEHGHIKLNQEKGTVEILDLNGAIADFSHQPQMLNPLISQGLYHRNKDLLEQGLTQAYQAQKTMIY